MRIILPYITSLLLVLFMLGCDTSTSIPSDLTALVNDEGARIEHEAIISLEDLNEESTNELWGKFFIQRGGEMLWENLQQALQNKEDALSFNFSRLNDSSEGISQQEQANQVAAGIIRYLVCHQIPVKLLSFGSNSFSLIDKGKYFHFIRDEIKYINSIPDEIGNLKSLEALDVSYHNFTDLTAEIGHLTNLQKLNLGCNQFKTLPWGIANLPRLKFLDLSNNELSSLPIQIYNLASLEVLDLSDNDFLHLPPEIGKLTSLENLLLSNNELVGLPPEIGKLTKLIGLNISCNNLSGISSEIGNLTSLKRLNLGTNQLTELPPELGKLINLEHLIISRNQLTKLPISLIHQLHRLNPSDIYGNPWLDVTKLVPINRSALENIFQNYASQALPHSLLTLCMHYIESQLGEQEDNIGIDLPIELTQIYRKFKLNTLREECVSTLGQNIIFLNKIERTHIPLYLDYPIYTYQDIKHILRNLEGKQLYKILESAK